MSEVNPIINGLDAALLEGARKELARFERARPDAVTLATIASLARTIEPELLRSLRLALGDRFSGKGITVAAESALWFSSLVESRGSEGITLLPEVLQVIRPRLAADRDLLEDARIIVEESHRSAPDVLQWEERIIYLSLTGRNVELEEEVLRGIYSISKGTRLPLANWIADMWTRLPREACQNPLMIKLSQVASSLSIRRSLATSGRGSSEGNVILDFSTLPTRELGVVLRGDRFVIGNVLAATFGIRVPDLNPVELDFSSGSETWESRVVIETDQTSEIDAKTGSVRVRTLAGQIYQFDAAFFRPSRRFRVAFSFFDEKRDFVAEVASVIAEVFGESAVFYDKYHEDDFARPDDLDLYLHELYSKESDLVVVVVSPGYDNKSWGRLERTAIYDLLQHRKDEVMFCRFEQAQVTGLYSTVGFVDLDYKTPAETATLILERLALNEGKPKNFYTTNAPSVSQPATTLTPNNLPRLQTFFGRKEELKQIAEALDPNSRTWGAVIDGPGGIGKTSLAVRAAYNTPPEQFERIIFLSVKDRELDDDGIRHLGSFVLPGFLEVLNELARELKQPEIMKAPESERARLVLDVLRSTRTLLIVDSVESLTKLDREQLFTFVKRLPQGCKALLTSRRRIGSSADALILGSLDETAALQTLADLAKHNPWLAKTSELDRRSLYEQVGGNPLLLRWTAGQLGRGSCRTIEDALKFLRSCPPDNDPSEFVFGELTSEFTREETRVLAALSHFMLPTRVEQVASVADLNEQATKSALHVLANRSVVTLDFSETEFSTVPLVATFLRKHRPEVVRETGQRLEQHAYALIVENGYKNFDRFHVLDAAWPTIAAALPLFVAGPNDRLQVVCDALQFFLDFTGRWDESLALAQEAEERAAASADYLKAGWRATDAGWIYSRRLESEKLKACSARALEYFDKANADNRAIGWAIRLRGLANQVAGNYSASIAAYRETIDLWSRESSENLELAIAYNDLAEVHRLSGDIDAAEGDYREALRLAQVLGYQEGAAESTGNLAALALDRASWQEAELFAREALHLAERIGRLELVASNSHLLARSVIHQGRNAEAVSHARRALEIYVKLGSPKADVARQTLLESEQTRGT